MPRFPTVFPIIEIGALRKQEESKVTAATRMGKYSVNSMHEAVRTINLTCALRLYPIRQCHSVSRQIWREDRGYGEYNLK